MTFGSSLLSAIPGLRHAFFSREGGVSGGIYEGLNGGLGSNAVSYTHLTLPTNREV